MSEEASVNTGAVCGLVSTRRGGRYGGCRPNCIAGRPGVETGDGAQLLKGGLRVVLVRAPTGPGARRTRFAEIHHFSSKACKWVLEGGIEAWFDEIDHVALMDRVRHRIGDSACWGW